MKKILPLIGLLILIASCSRETKLPETETVLARVGDKVITTREFRHRVELTPRPGIASEDDASLKKILLNNLIAEKLFAIESEASSELAQKETFKAHIKGIKEQTMRERLYFDVAFDTVKIDTNSMKNGLHMSCYKYDVEFYTLNSDDLAQKVDSLFADQPDSREKIFDNLWSGQTPVQEVKYRDPDFDQIHDALFTKPVDPGSVLGPIQLDRNQHIVMKVKDWKYEPLWGGEEVAMRWNQVEEKLKEKKANKVWKNYMASVMEGVQIEFDRDMFKKMADFSMDMYYAPDQDRKKEIARDFWDETEGDEQKTLPSDEQFINQPFFTVNGKVWTVGDFRKALLSHPLVYRKESFTRNEGYMQFKFAVADLIRDLHLNEKAYKKGLDKHYNAVQKENMWRDALVALEYRDKVLNKVSSTVPDGPGRQLLLNEAFTAYLDSLKQYYSEEILVDLDELEEIEITRVNMYAYQKQVPYPIAVPSFPLIGRDANLDYANVINSKKK